MGTATSAQTIAPEHTAVRVALWRALHLELDSEPYVLVDDVGAKLVGEGEWRTRPDMNPQFSKAMRASIVGRSRFIEDLVEEREKQGVTQYVILGAGLDTFAQRRAEIASRMQVYEIDQSGPQLWKKKRLVENGFPLPEWLHFVSADFEGERSWWDYLISAGFDVNRPAIAVSTGVSMYLSKEANFELLQRMAKLAPGSTFAMTFLLSLELLPNEERAALEYVMKRAEMSGTPFLSLFSPPELLDMAERAGFKSARYVSAHDLYLRYFAGRKDGLRAGTAEGFLVVD